MHKLNQIVADPSLYRGKSSHAPLLCCWDSNNTWCFRDLWRSVSFTVQRPYLRAITCCKCLLACLAASPWLIHSRAFMEYCVQRWDNLLPLMYLSNTASPLESYFHWSVLYMQLSWVQKYNSKQCFKVQYFGKLYRWRVTLWQNAKQWCSICKAI